MGLGRFWSVLALLAVMACDRQLPLAETTISAQARAAPFPQLVPTSDLVAQASQGADISREARAVAGRAAALRQRARALRGRDIFEGQEALRNL